MIVLQNATYIDWKTMEFRQADISVSGGIFSQMTCLKPRSVRAGQSGQTVIDCSGKYVTKSWGNGHHHIYSALARGMPAPPVVPTNFYEILDHIWWRLDKSLTLDIIKASALFTAMECARQGVTFVIDHHASPFAAEGSLETIAKAFEQVGVSHLLCLEISDRDGEDVRRKCLLETEDYLSKRPGLVGLHASFTVDNDTLRAAVDLARKYDSGIHIHVAEDGCDQDDSEGKYGMRVVDRLHAAGVMEMPKSILVHCLHLSSRERELIAGAPCWLAQNTESNLNNNVGYFNGEGLNQNIMLGTDGMHSDMLRSARAAYFTGKGFDNINLTEAYRRFRNIHEYLQTNEFAGDGPANLVVLDYPTPTPIDSNNFLGHFIYGMESRHVTHVISDGRLIVKERKVLSVDEEDVLAFSREMAKKLWDRIKDTPSRRSR